MTGRAFAFPTRPADPRVTSFLFEKVCGRYHPPLPFVKATVCICDKRATLMNVELARGVPRKGSAVWIVPQGSLYLIEMKGNVRCVRAPFGNIAQEQPRVRPVPGVFPFGISPWMVLQKKHTLWRFSVCCFQVSQPGEDRGPSGSPFRRSDSPWNTRRTGRGGPLPGQNNA